MNKMFSVSFKECSSFTHLPTDSYLLRSAINLILRFPEPYFVGNKAKGRISKRVFQENKARQILRKTIISGHLIRTRLFEICPFALLPTIFYNTFRQVLLNYLKV